MRTDFLAAAADGPTAGSRPFVDGVHRRSRPALSVPRETPDLPLSHRFVEGGI